MRLVGWLSWLVRFATGDATYPVLISNKENYCSVKDTNELAPWRRADGTASHLFKTLLAFYGLRKFRYRIYKNLSGVPFLKPNEISPQYSTLLI
jgi:hypothetical protein